jgi:hypothetical protein
VTALHQNSKETPMKTRPRKSIAAAALIAAAAALGGAAAALAPLASASATTSHTVTINAKLTVTNTSPPVCTGGICTIDNQGTGTMTPYGNVTFTTVITFDTNQPPCGAGSQWVNRIVRTIDTNEGVLVLHEAGLLCPIAGAGTRVEAVWAADGADSTGLFQGATGNGHDVAYPMQGTAAPRGTITLTP